MKKLCLILFITISFISCKKSDIPETKEPANTETVPQFKLEAKYNTGTITEDINFNIGETEFSALIPTMENKKMLVISFNSADIKVKVDGVAQVSGQTINNFSKPLTYVITYPDGKEKTYTVKVVNFTGIPIFYINTAGVPIVSKDDYLTGTLAINPNSQYEQEKETLPMEIKGRGNSTWGMPKKPYRIKLNDKAKILGLGAAKNWVLLANYSDKTLIRTSTVFSLGKAVNADFTPSGIHVELVLNGEYEGNYLLTEQVEVNENRVNITELKKGDIDDDKITGGYLLEYDQRQDEEVMFKTNKQIPLSLKSPKEINEKQLNYIKKYMQDTEDAIFSADFADPLKGYAKYIDVNSFINWFLVQELVKNQDAKDFSSIFYHKNRNAKLGMGPLWDFDLSMGNVDYSAAVNAEGWWVKDGIWFKRLFEDPAFKTKVRNRWKEIRAKEIPDALKNIDKQASYLQFSQQRNFKKWDILGTQVWPNPAIYYTYSGEVNQIKIWLNKRVAWMDSNL